MTKRKKTITQKLKEAKEKSTGRIPPKHIPEPLIDDIIVKQGGIKKNIICSLHFEYGYEYNDIAHALINIGMVKTRNHVWLALNEDIGAYWLNRRGIDIKRRQREIKAAEKKEKENAS